MKEDISKFDFTKDFAEQEVWEKLKEEIIKEIQECLNPWRYNGENLACSFGGDVLAYEVNDKLYPVMKWRILAKQSSGYGKYFMLTITPFNCYWWKWGDKESFNDDSKHIDLTKAFRSIMRDKYGEAWKTACKDFLIEVKDLQIGLERASFEHRAKIIQNKYEDDANLVEL